MIGVSSISTSDTPDGSIWCPEPFPFCDFSYKSSYADITAPPMKAWIEGIVNSGGGSRWEGQTDYVRTAFGTPGCDVATNPACDPGCDAKNDRDCDLVYDLNDNCPDDYNSDQRNSDDPVSVYDPQSPFDDGDVCDSCIYDKENGLNCNDDAEVLKYGFRPHFREDSIIGNPTSPSTSPEVSKAQSRYLGDACDPAPCTELGSKTIELDPTVYGSPNPGTPACVLAAYFNGYCGYTANVRIERDGRTVALLDGFTGSTGHRICECSGPFATQLDRVQNCFISALGAQCPQLAAQFTTSTALAKITVNPPFTTIPTAPSETGTVGDVFTFLPKTVRPAYRWLFESDVSPITGLPNPTLPLSDATAAAIAIDGLIQSNVREHPALGPSSPYRDLASYWAPEILRVNPAPVGGVMQQSMLPIPAPGEDCKTCGLGLSKPWYLVSPTELPAAIFAATQGSAIEMSARVDSDVLAMLRLAGATPSREILSSGEHASLLRRRAEPFGARFAVLDPSSLTFLGAIAEDENGRILQVRGRTVGAEQAMIACSDGGPMPCAGAHSPMIASAAALSTLQEAIFVLRRGTGESHARLHRFDLLHEIWSEIPLAGFALPGVPLAMTYDAQANALFVVDRAHVSGHGPGRLFRIALDGRIELVEHSVGLSQESQVFLTSTESGNLLLAATGKKNSKFAITHIDALHEKMKALGRFKGKGKLLAAPFLTDRALYVLRIHSGTVEALEIDPKELQHPGGGIDCDLD